MAAARGVWGGACCETPDPAVTGSGWGEHMGLLEGTLRTTPRHRGLPGALVSGGQLCRPRGFAPGSRGRGRCPSGVGAARDGPVPLAGGLPGGAGAEVLRCVAHRGAPPACLGQSRPGRSTGSGIQSQVSLPAEGTAEPGPAGASGAGRPLQTRPCPLRSRGPHRAVPSSVPFSRRRSTLGEAGLAASVSVGGGGRV